MPLADLEFVAILLSLPPKCWITGMCRGGGGAAAYPISLILLR